MIRDLDKITGGENFVVQKYIHNPLLIEGLKFDLRIYVLLTGIDPLRIFIYKEGIVRFATVPYQRPDQDNITNMFMHLTNYAINKHHKDF